MDADESRRRTQGNEGTAGADAFDEDEVAAVLDACDRYPLNGIYGAHNRTRRRALTLLMRYCGLRIGDAVPLPHRGGKRRSSGRAKSRQLADFGPAPQSSLTTSTLCEGQNRRARLVGSVMFGALRAAQIPSPAQPFEVWYAAARNHRRLVDISARTP